MSGSSTSSSASGGRSGRFPIGDWGCGEGGRALGSGDPDCGGAFGKESFDCVRAGLNFCAIFDDNPVVGADWVDGVVGLENLFGLAGWSLDLAVRPNCSCINCFAISAVAASGRSSSASPRIGLCTLGT